MLAALRSTINHKALNARFARRGPWITKFHIDGHDYGGWFDPTPPADVRIDTFAAHFPGARRILELGTLEGGHAFQLARLPGVREVVAVEARESNLERARFVRRVLGIENVKLVQGDLETLAIGSLGWFDAIFCAGLLYHLTRPWDLAHRMRAISPDLFLSTHYAAEDKADTVANGLHGLTYREGGIASPLAGLSPTAFWPTLDSLVRMLKEVGYRDITITKDRPDHLNGPAVHLVAKGESPPTITP